MTIQIEGPSGILGVKGTGEGALLVASARRAGSVYRASAALAGSGAYDAVAWVEIPDGATRISYAWKYTLDPTGTGGGYAAMRPQFKCSDIEGEIFRDVEIETAASSGGEIVKSAYGMLVKLRGASAVGFVLVFRVAPGMTHFAAPAAEVGDTAHPGTLAAWITVGS